MNAHNYLTVLVLALALLPGCRRDGADALVSRESGGLVRVEIEAMAEWTEPVAEFDLARRFQPVGEFRLGDTRENYIDGPKEFKYYDAGSVLVSGLDRVLRVSVIDGTPLQEYGRKGRGPGEFVQVESCFGQADRVYVTDTGSQVHVYEADGTSVKDFLLLVPAVQFCELAPLGGEAYLLNYSSLSGKDRYFDVVDAGMKLVRQGSLHPDDSDLKKGAIRPGASLRFDDRDCVMSGDTLYHVTPQKDRPYWYFAKKKTKGIHFEKMSNWFFVQASTDSHDFRMVVDVRTGTPVFYAPLKKTSMTVATQRGPVTVPSTDPEDRARFGIPYVRDGEERHIWPVLADRDLLICNDCQETDYYYCFHLKK